MRRHYTNTDNPIDFPKSNPLEEFLTNETEDELEFQAENSAYDIYRIEMDAKFEALDAVELAYYWTLRSHPDARARLVHALLPMVPSICQKLQAAGGRPDRNQWDDCIQAGNLAILESLESWNPEGGTKLSVWAYQYARTYIVREISDTGMTYGYEPRADDNSDDGEQVRLTEDGIDFETIRKLMVHLTGRQQTVVNLRLNGASIAEAAALMGIRRDTAQELYARAVVALRELVEEPPQG